MEINQTTFNTTLFLYHKEGLSVSFPNLSELALEENSTANHCLIVNEGGFHNAWEHWSKLLHLPEFSHFGLSSSQLKLPRFEEGEGYLFLCIKGMKWCTHPSQMEYIPIYCLLHRNQYLCLYWEGSKDFFKPIEKKLSENMGGIRSKGLDTLLGLIFESTITSYYTQMEHLQYYLNEVEEKIQKHPNISAGRKCLNIKRELRLIQRNLLFSHEALAELETSQNELIEEKTYKQLSRTHRHISQLKEHIIYLRDITEDAYRSYQSVMNNQTRDTMRFLAILSTIFLPLTYFAGIYGMNFQNLPELHWHYGYLYFWILNVITIIILLIFFRRKKWL